MLNRGKERPPAEEDPESAAEVAWLREHRAAFMTIARDRYYICYGRGALVIDASSEPLGEDTPFRYAPQARIEEQQDEVSQQLAGLVDNYEPEKQFVAVFIRPDNEFTFSMYQIGVRESELER